MDSDIIWLSAASHELETELDYVFCRFGFLSARKAYEIIMKRICLLPSFPHLGTLYYGLLYLGNEVRQLHIRHVTIFYSPCGNMITILAVWNNSKNPENITERLQVE